MLRERADTLNTISHQGAVEEDLDALYRGFSLDPGGERGPHHGGNEFTKIKNIIKAIMQMAREFGFQICRYSPVTISCVMILL